MTDDTFLPIEEAWDGSPAGGLSDMALAAASYELAMLSGDGGRTTKVEPLPAGLGDAVRRAAAAHVVRRVSGLAGGEPPRAELRPTSSAPESRGVGWQRLVSLAGWGVAACLGLALLSRSTLSPREGIRPDPEAAAVRPAAADPAEKRRALLLAEDPTALSVAWAAGEDRSVTGLPEGMTHGDVVWSQSRQQGYMRFRGLAANDPAVEQYQLWIFDAERDAAHPVDGGVFDVADADGEVCVPIDPRLPIGKPTLFAITVEKPGGVVVSKRERLPLLAKVP
jgi:hypothetical protein